MSKKPEKQLILWNIQGSQYDDKGKFTGPLPKIIKVYDDETCTFFTSKKAKDYIPEIDAIFLEGGLGDLTGQKQHFKQLAILQSKGKPKKKVKKNS